MDRFADPENVRDYVGRSDPLAPFDRIIASTPAFSASGRSAQTVTTSSNSLGKLWDKLFFVLS